MIEFEVHPARTFFSGAEDELEVMFRRLRVRNKNAHWAAQAALRRMTFIRYLPREEKDAKTEEITERAKYIRFYNRRTDSFASGLLSRVKKYLREKQIKYKVHDLRKHVHISSRRVKKFPFWVGVEQRDEQLIALKNALDKQRGLLSMATNAGKTEVAGAIIYEYIKQTGKIPNVLFLVHRKSLVKQTGDRFKSRLKRKIEVIYGGSDASGRLRENKKN